MNNNRLEYSAIRYGNRKRQSGVVLPIVIIGLIAIIAMAGLAIDSSHAFVNKTRLQNMVDSAALTAAKVYDQSADTIISTAAAHAMFGRNSDGSGNFEIDGEYDGGNITVTVQFSETLNPFVPAALGPYIRVIATGFSVTTGFVSVIGITNIGVDASAVAGPSPTINHACNIAPLVACAVDAGDVGPGGYFGFEEDKLMVLKPSPGDHNDVGPGNYKLLRLNCPGGACVRDNMAGVYDACATADTEVDTEPGVTAGPTSQGFNTRFGEYAGPVDPADFPPDVVTEATLPALDTQQFESPPGSGIYEDQICIGACDDPVAPTNLVEFANVGLGMNVFDYADYVAKTIGPPRLHDFPTAQIPYSAEWRRIMAMPVADCAGDQTGQSTLNVIGFACYFMLQPIGGGTDKNIFGQFVEGCLAGGTPGLNPGDGPGPYIIQLYRDPDSTDS